MWCTIKVLVEIVVSFNVKSMSKNLTLFIFGVLVAVLPFSGFPSVWKNIFFVLLGLGVAFVAVLLSKRIN